MLSTLLIAGGALCGRQFAWAADSVGKLVDAVANAPSWKVRLQAAAVLSRMRDPRVAGALGRAAITDVQPTVRAFAAQLLGGNPGGDATDARVRSALERASRDPHASVRTAAQGALARLSPPAAQKPPVAARALTTMVAIGSVGDRTGQASASAKQQLRQEIARNLSAQPRVSVAAGIAGAGYVVDGVIRRMDLITRATEMETICSVELVVSKPPRGIVMVSTGEALVQRPKRQYRPAHREEMEHEALVHAVKSAHENLARFFASGR